MSSKIVHISDFYYPDLLGGGELNNHELIRILKDKKKEVLCLKSDEVQLEKLKKMAKHFFIISNFIFLDKKCMLFLEKNCRYLIYEHDHKYLKSRNPAMYNDFLAPKDQIVNKSFYEKAQKVLCQSSFHKEIIEKNLKIDNLISLSGNLWSVESLKLLNSLSKNKKESRISILDSFDEHKNTRDSETYCIVKKIPYEKIKSSEYHDFLVRLSKNDKFLFLPKTPETFSRIVIEAKIMGVKVITNKNVGASYEDWYNSDPEEILEVMIKKRDEISDLIIKEFHG